MDVSEFLCRRDFGNDLKASLDGKDLFKAAYISLLSRIGLTVVSMQSKEDDAICQRLGFDRVVLCTNGATYRFEEKDRHAVYPDILLEFLHRYSSGRESHGWAEKVPDEVCVAYLKRPTRECFFMPGRKLKQAWRQNKDTWITTYGVREAFTQGNGDRWVTLNCPVPHDELFSAMGYPDWENRLRVKI